MNPKQPAIYIVASKKNGTLYTGVTSNLSKRIWEHKNKITKGFAAKYNLDQLVYCEHYESIEEAITREKILKNWKRDWKIKLIEAVNPHWNDLYLTLNS